RASVPLAPGRNTRIKVVIELDDAPVIETVARMHGQGAANSTMALVSRAQLATIEQHQQQLLALLPRLEASVIYRVQRVYNGIAVQLPANKLATLAHLPGIKAIHALTPKQLSLVASVPFIGTPLLWSNPSSLTGKGRTIAVIDSGIDY